MKSDTVDLIFKTAISVFIFLLLLMLGLYLVITWYEQGQDGQDLEYKAVLNSKTGIFQFETESERCFVANKVGYAPSISCVKK